MFLYESLSEISDYVTVFSLILIAEFDFFNWVGTGGFMLALDLDFPKGFLNITNN